MFMSINEIYRVEKLLRKLDSFWRCLTAKIRKNNCTVNVKGCGVYYVLGIKDDTSFTIHLLVPVHPNKDDIKEYPPHWQA